MKKILISALALTMLCGCASKNNSSKKSTEPTASPATEDITTTASAEVMTTKAVTTTSTVTTTAAETVTTTISTNDDKDHVWIDTGVYEIQLKAEKTPDKPYDDRFLGEFYVFFSPYNGEIISAFDGVISVFTCEQKEHSITFHYTSVWKNSSLPVGYEYDEAYPDKADDINYRYFDFDENGDLTLWSSPSTLNKLIRIPDADPHSFNAEDYRDNYVTESMPPRAVGSYACWGKKLG